jgi:hypothetical protein
MQNRQSSLPPGPGSLLTRCSGGRRGNRPLGVLRRRLPLPRLLLGGVGLEGPEVAAHQLRVAIHAHQLLPHHVCRGNGNGSGRVGVGM